jgi:hypothetical protein
MDLAVPWTAMISPSNSEVLWFSSYFVYHWQVDFEGHVYLLKGNCLLKSFQWKNWNALHHFFQNSGLETSHKQLNVYMIKCCCYAQINHHENHATYVWMQSSISCLSFLCVICAGSTAAVECLAAAGRISSNSSKLNVHKIHRHSL